VSDVWLYSGGRAAAAPRRLDPARGCFYGSDLSFEELEAQHFEEWELRLAPEVEAYCACDVVEARPPHDSQYGRLLLWIDRAQAAWHASTSSAARSAIRASGSP